MMHILRILVVLIVFVGVSVKVEAQLLFKYNDSIAVYDTDNNPLSMAWMGGLNLPQYSSIDVDADGVNELYIFDRSAKKSILLKKEGANFYRIPEAENWFPKSDYWSLLRDFNQDGLPDYFMGVSGGIKVYKNISTTEQLAFEEVTSKILYTSSSNNQVNVYVSTVDIPGIDDVDNDGDLDVLTFSILGGKMEWYENLAVQENDIDSFYMVKSASCWGRFEESSSSESIELQACSGRSNDVHRSSRHTGSSTLIVDPDQDGLVDLIIGDVSGTKLSYLTNSGVPGNSNITAIDQSWPINDVPVEMTPFVIPFKVDLDNDGQTEIVVSNGGSADYNSIESSWLYDYGNGSFSLTEKGFLQNKSLDFGEGSRPVFYDYDKDGLTDIVVATNYFQRIGGANSKISVLKNVGSETAPSFRFVDSNWIDLSFLDIIGAYPTFGDLDNDGVDEVLIGESSGWMHLYKKSGDTFILSQPRFFNIRVSSFSVPFLFDKDLDGDLDLFVGEGNGTLNYIENIGTTDSAIFDSIETNFLGANVKMDNHIYGSAAPHVFRTDTSVEYLIGSYSGQIHRISVNLNDSITLSESYFSNINDGLNSFVSVADVDNDAHLEMLVGNTRGGLSWYSSTDSVAKGPWTKSDLIKSNQLVLYPNPSKGVFLIQGINVNQIEVYSVLGKRIFTLNQTNTLDIQNQENGMYLLKITDVFGNKYEKRIIKY